MAQITELKKQRATVKAKFTRFINFLKDADNDTNYREIELRLNKVENSLDLFEGIQNEIDSLTEETSDDFNEFEKLYFSTMSRAYELIDTKKSFLTASAVGAAEIATFADNTRVHAAQRHNQVRLPKIELTTFNGSYENWLDFYNSFKSMVHDNLELTGIQKLHYLRSSLKGEASYVINALETSHENYEVAWDLITTRYNNTRVIAQKHIKTLMEVPSISRESAYDLRKLIDTIRTHLRALKTLGQPVDSWDGLLIYSITNKLDRNSHREWEKSITGSEMPRMTDFMSFLEQRCQVLQATIVNINPNNMSNSYTSFKSNQNNMHKRQVFALTKNSDGCILCKGSHQLHRCEVFQKMTVRDRIEKMKALKFCFNCLHNGHRNDNCKWTGCKKCGKNHNTMLHLEDKDYKHAQDENEKKLSFEQPQSSTKNFSTLISTQMLLSTALINMKGKNGNTFQARVLLDNGSQSHFIRRNFAEFLNLPFENIDIPVESLNQLETRIKHKIRAEIQSQNSNYKETLEFLVVPKICDHLPNQLINRKLLNIPKNIQLADPGFYKPDTIDALIGVEVFYDLLCVGQIEIAGYRAKLQKTKLGWIIAGKFDNNENKIKSSKCMFVQDNLHKFMTKFWEIEEIGEKKFLSEEEFQAEEHFKNNTTRDPHTGRYTVKLAFNEKIERLGNSQKLTEKQFLSLERRLAKSPDLKGQYIEYMRESIASNHMIKLNEGEISSKHCFLPHHHVIKESSLTTKLRVVYNASSKTSTGISLNDCLKIGPVVQNTSFDIVLRFRTHQIVLLADIEKMYKQIYLDKNDAQYQLSFWRENENDNLHVYCIPVVLFGCASAPYLATRTLNQLAEDEKLKFPMASKIVPRDFYVDDLMTGADNIKEAKQLRDELIGITKAGGFTLRKWSSNNSEILDSLPIDTKINLLNDDSLGTKALGIQWNTLTDKITYNVKEREFNTKITKRSVLSNIARIYDPIGLLGPVIVNAKLLMQRIWQSNTDWDESLPQDIHTAWLHIKEQLPALNKIEFERKTVIHNAIRTEIHGFCDASEKAYGACIYIKSKGSDGTVMINLLCSKNRVAPLKTISLPKLELCAALLLSQLIKSVLDALTKNIDDIFLWSDSSITLQWINTQPSLLKTFVANRVSEIREATSTMHWRHTPSQGNAADILSRGQLPREFLENKSWKVGPEWLRREPNHWPSNIIQSVPLIELKVTRVFTNIKGPIDFFKNCNTFVKAKRVMAYILRFKNRRNNINKVSGELTYHELESAAKEILKIIQKQGFSDDYKQLSQQQSVTSNSSLRALNPFLDDEGLIRVGGRLKNSVLSYAEKYPIVLPKDNHLTNLIIKEKHILNMHGGIQTTLNAVRARYWPIGGKNATKIIIKKCINCFRAKPTNYSYFMGDLPRDRVTQARPFLNSGVDYCGPFYIKEKKHRNRGKVKVYACIFVCFAIKAIHIELISDLTTETFIGGLRRFFSRRGRAANLYSDNATYFVGARNELESLSKLIQSKEHNKTVSNFLSNGGTRWHFSPPNSPHFGGLWEAAVKSFKNHYYRTIGDKLFTYEELLTYTTEIEAILNSRPITPISEDPNDLRALTPAHFLIGDTFTNIPEVNVMNVPVNRLSTWRHIQYIKQHFWSRWYKEYLNQLITRSKWQRKGHNDIKIGTLVLLKEDNTSTLHWPLGRITEIHPGDDGIVRVVCVKTNSGIYKRSITRIVPLPID